MSFNSSISIVATAARVSSSGPMVTFSVSTTPTTGAKISFAMTIFAVSFSALLISSRMPSASSSETGSDKPATPPSDNLANSTSMALKRAATGAPSLIAPVATPSTRAIPNRERFPMGDSPHIFMSIENILPINERFSLAFVFFRRAASAWL